MKSWRETLQKELSDDEFKKEWDALEPEYQIMESILKSRKENHISQQKLSSLTGITQSDISKIENGTYNPSLKMLKRIANGLNCKLSIKFVNIENNKAIK